MNLQKLLFGLLVLLLPTQFAIHFWPSFSYVQGLRIDYLSPTIYLTDILIFVLFLVTLPYLFKKIHFLYLVIGLFFVTTSLLAINPGVAFVRLFKILEMSFLIYYVANFEYAKNLLLKLLPIVLLYSSLIAIAQFIMQSSLGGVFWFLGERTFNVMTPGIAKITVGDYLLLRSYGTFSHPNALAGFILVSTLVIILSKLKTSRIEAAIKNLSLLFGVVAFALTFSRSAWLTTAVIVFIELFTLYREKRLNKIIATLTMSVIFILSTLFVFNNFVILRDNAVDLRIDLNQKALEMIRDYPLSGVGLNNYIPALDNYISGDGRTTWYQPVHNIYLLVGSETGVVGLLLFITGIGIVVRKSIKTKYLLVSIITILFLGLFDHYWLTLQQNLILMVIIIGLIVSSGRSSIVVK